MISVNHPATHLHWSYSTKDSNRLLNETKRGLAVCGAQAPRHELAIDIANVTCPQCEAKAKAAESQTKMTSQPPIPKARTPKTKATGQSGKSEGPGPRTSRKARGPDPLL
jgi:hypothetical protein